MRKILIALGGNALLRNGDDGSYATQLGRARETFLKISETIDENEVIITHGNGPQVGSILLQNENSASLTHPMPLHACGAMSQGLIGEILLSAYDSMKFSRGMMKEGTVIITRTLVDPSDPAFENPTKPIGHYYDEKTAARLSQERGWKMREEKPKGYRRVVPSPLPRDIVERTAIFSCLNDGYMPICAGGGGIPVVRTQDGFTGIDAVIDKDLASSLLAAILEVDRFVILTDVPGVYRGFGKPSQELIERIGATELEREFMQGDFPSGSMGPKVQAAMDFVRRTGKEAVIGSLDSAGRVTNGEEGTVIY